jgi:hypothetical protein
VKYGKMDKICDIDEIMENYQDKEINVPLIEDLNGKYSISLAFLLHFYR